MISTIRDDDFQDERPALVGMILGEGRILGRENGHETEDAEIGQDAEDLFFSASSASTSRASGLPMMSVRSTGLVESGLLRRAGGDGCVAARRAVRRAGWTLAGVGGGAEGESGDLVGGSPVVHAVFPDERVGGQLVARRDSPSVPIR